MNREALESGRAVIRCRFLGPNNQRQAIIKVTRFDPPSHGLDPNRLTVAWDYSLGLVANYVAAVQKYIDRADWTGTWVVSTIPDGAIAVCVPYTHTRRLATLVESWEILDELEMTHLLSPEGA